MAVAASVAVKGRVARCRVPVVVAGVAATPDSGAMARARRPSAGSSVASWKGRQARHPPTTWFQQFEQHELEQSGQTRNALFPAEPSRSRSSPQSSQNVLASSTGSGPSSFIDRALAEPCLDDMAAVG